MKSKGCLIALGVVGVLAVVVFIAAGIFLNKAKSIVEGVAEGAGVAPELVQEAKSLNQKYDFQIPQDNVLSERQIERFIEIKETFADKIAPHLKTFEKLDAKSRHEDTDFSDIALAWKTLGEIHKDFLKALNEHQMSPREYAYLSKQIYSTYFAAAAKEGQEQMAKTLDKNQQNYAKQLQQFDEQLNDPNVDDELKAAIRKAKEQYITMMRQSEQASREMGKQVQEFPQQNIELLKKYREKLKALNTYGYEFWGLALAEAE